MSSVTILGDTSGSILLQAPAVAGSPTLTLPTTSGTVMVGSGVGAWTAYTPTISSASGSFTTVSASGAYQTIGKTCIVSMTINITTSGTAGSPIYATLPFTGANRIQICGYGMEVNSTGYMLKGYLGASGQSLQITTYSNGSTIGNGYSVIMTIVYETA